MISYETLFWLILAALILLTAVVLGIIYVLIKGEDERKSKAKERSVIKAAQQCPHFFGYLAEQSPGQPIPSECFGCAIGMECKEAVAMEVTVRRRKK